MTNLKCIKIIVNITCLLCTKKNDLRQVCIKPLIISRLFNSYSQLNAMTHQQYYARRISNRAIFESSHVFMNKIRYIFLISSFFYEISHEQFLA